MLEKEFVPHNESLELKELGFDEPCFAFYEEDTNNLVTFHTDSYQEVTGHVCLDRQVNAPTFSQTFRWFRDKYNLHNGIYPYYDEYEFQIKDFRLPTNKPINSGLMSYEESEIQCLRKLIEIVKSK
jgi:hypothetical protein